ncbi:MAG: hypothetical protein U0074_02420 [Kouleothrix sp.]
MEFTPQEVSFVLPALLGLLITDLLCACMVSAITLHGVSDPRLFCHFTNYMPKTVLVERQPDAMMQIMLVGALMLALLVVYTACNTFVDYQGHMMGSLMEMTAYAPRAVCSLPNPLVQLLRRAEDREAVMTRLTNDLFSLSEFYHHGPEDMTIADAEVCGCVRHSLWHQCAADAAHSVFHHLHGICVFYFNRIMNRALPGPGQRPDWRYQCAGGRHARGYARGAIVYQQALERRNSPTKTTDSLKAAARACRSERPISMKAWWHLGSSRRLW